MRCRPSHITRGAHSSYLPASDLRDVVSRLRLRPVARYFVRRPNISIHKRQLKALWGGCQGTPAVVRRHSGTAVSPANAFVSHWADGAEMLRQPGDMNRKSICRPPNRFRRRVAALAFSLMLTEPTHQQRHLFIAGDLLEILVNGTGRRQADVLLMKEGTRPHATAATLGRAPSVAKTACGPCRPRQLPRRRLGQVRNGVALGPQRPDPDAGSSYQIRR